MKHRLVFILLLLFAIWPLVHYGLMQHYQLNPWKYGGWAMYVVPGRNPELGVSVRVRDEWHALEVEQPALLREANRFAVNRRQQGFRLEPADLGRALLERIAEAQAVRITVDDFKLDPETARVQLSTYAYEYSR